MKHLNKNFISNLQFIGEGNIYRINICEVYKEFIKDLIKNGFSISEIVTIFNFLFYQLNINFRLKYYHIYYCVKRKINNLNDIF